MKFNSIIGNPPYQNGTNDKSAVSSQLWDKFVNLSLSLLEKDGYLCMIHPSSWRKPEHKLYNCLKAKQFKYLEIHNMQDGLKTFKCATRYDWYILKNSVNNANKTMVIDENGIKITIDLNEWDFLPNAEYDLMKKCIATKEEKCNVMYSRSAYGCDKPHISKEKTKEFKYPCVTMMTKTTPLKLNWSKINSKGHFNKQKVLINITGSTLCCLIDEKGEYGMTQWICALGIKSKREGELIKKALMSSEFQKIWKATQWLSMTREWRIFKYFRKDFYKEFI